MLGNAFFFLPDAVTFFSFFLFFRRTLGRDFVRVGHHAMGAVQLTLFARREVLDRVKVRLCCMCVRIVSYFLSSSHAECRLCYLSYPCARHTGLRKPHAGVFVCSCVCVCTRRTHGARTILKG